MGLKRKGSRLITVGGETFRWTVSRSIQAKTGNISIIFEAVAHPGQRIAVRVPCRDFWLDFPDLRDAPPAGFPGAYAPVTPRTVQQIISEAMTAGWQPAQRQKNLAYEWTSDAKLLPLGEKKE